MSQPLEDTWSWRDLPVLREAVRGADANPIVGIRFDEVARLTGLDLDHVVRAGYALEHAGLLETSKNMGPGHSNRFTRVSARARQLAGSWPSEETGADRIVAVLQAIEADEQQSDDTRGRARRALDAVTGAGRDLGIAVAAAVITGQITH